MCFKLLLRLRESARHFLEGEDKQLAEKYTEFYQFLGHFAFWSLAQPTSNFNRRTMALTLIELLMEDSDVHKLACLRETLLEIDGARHAILVRELDDAYQWNQSKALEILVKLNDSHEMHHFVSSNVYLPCP